MLKHYFFNLKSHAGLIQELMVEYSLFKATKCIYYGDEMLQFSLLFDLSYFPQNASHINNNNDHKSSTALPLTLLIR